MNTYHAQAQLLQKNFGQAGIAAPQTWYIGFFTGTGPAPSGTLTTNEVSGGGYQRKSVLNTTDEWQYNSTPRTITNKNILSFATATADWPAPISYVGFWDNSSNGNLWFYEPLSVAKQIQSGTTILFEAGSLTISNP